ncbi:DNA-binding domain-containing protein, partial [Aquabacterium sp.]|uniref:DNA-binding domain-containing protein n=1 Tax=Aquabacterium sp. TaxID=1872578 RepID=UPI001991E871
HVLAGDAAALTDVASVVPGSAAQRLGIYHHAYRARLQETLRDSFGHTLLYLGDEWFDALSAEFIEAHPSESANLRWYGGAYPDWLAPRLKDADSALGDHPEVAEIARLDWTMRAAFDGVDAPVLSMADVAALAPDDWATVVFKPHPTLALISLRCNTLSLWHALDQEAEVPPVEALPSPMDVVVWRIEERPHFRSVAPIEAAALRAVMQGQAFAAMCGLLAELLPEDENAAALAGGYLRRWIDEGLLAGLHC